MEARETAAIGEERSEEPALPDLEALFDPEQTPTWELIDRARRIREQGFGNRVHLCSILNAKSGACSENCAFCTQSRHHRSAVQVYPLITVKEAIRAAREAEALGARCFGLVTSGRSLTGARERQRFLKIVEAIRTNTELQVGCSIGLASSSFLRDLRSAGLNTFHHNLETAASHYPEICTSHGYEERLATLQAAQEAGFAVCSGGIFGMGESAAQRAEFALTLRRLGVDRIPVNFLNPLPGTAMEGRPLLDPLEALHIVAALRVTVLPRQEILVCGGREVTLRSLQPLLFQAGANGIMTGNYLTTAGQGVEADKAMLTDLGLDFRPSRGSTAGIDRPPTPKRGRGREGRRRPRRSDPEEHPRAGPKEGR